MIFGREAMLGQLHFALITFEKDDVPNFESDEP